MAPRDVNKPPPAPGPTMHMSAGVDSGSGPTTSGPQGSVSTSGFATANPAGFASTLPVVALPKGGGAIRGIDEKLTVTPSSGSCTLSIPIAVSKARTAAGTPSLTLSYNSGAGNGPFGLGWGISVPTITRKTSKGVPRYFDDGTEDDDVFVFSAADDLVPRLLQTHGSSTSTLDEVLRDGYIVRRYLPRIEGSFFQIERFTNSHDWRDVFWRVRTGDNQEQIYGRDNESRIQDGDGRIYSWLLSHSSDRYGNEIDCSYKAEDSAAVSPTACENNRTDDIRGRNRYLSSIKYGNRVPYQREAIPAATESAGVGSWMFEVLFDYGERIMGDTEAKVGPWTCREDAFSTYRAGFEIRTYRLCRRILMFHRFPNELGDSACLVSSTCFEYTESKVASLLSKVSSFGHVGETGVYTRVPRPAITLSYTVPPKLEDLEVCDSDTSLDISGSKCEWIDLDSEGLLGLLCEQPGGWYYRRNLSANNIVDSAAAPKFGPLELVSSWPSCVPKTARRRFTDLDATGDVDLLAVDPTNGLLGFYERTTADGWTNFSPFSSWPNINLSQPNVQFVDLTGDGRADILVTEDNAFSWYRSLGKEGYDHAGRALQSLDEDQGPKLVFEDGSQTIYLADFSGDGLHDLVRVRNADICYWPSLGYGEFGEKVTMGNAPWFDTPELFSRERLRLIDIYGSGTTDLIYLPGEGGVDIYLNQAGNQWSSKLRMPFPQTDSISSVSTVDLLGNGCGCLVWTRPLTAVGYGMRYLDLTQGTKPYLLESYTNDLGLETKMTYVPSTRFYLEAQQSGTPWATRLPFPVHCVAKKEIFDHVSKSYSSTQYSYHDGFYDRLEREFRGFGVVEQWDTTGGSNSVNFPAATNMEKAYLVTATRQKTWFHTGANILPPGIPKHPMVADYFQNVSLLDPTQIPQNPSDGLHLGEVSRSMKGKILREEFYVVADPTDPRPSVPFHVCEKNYNITIVQPKSPACPGVYFVSERESITVEREREPDNPRITHKMHLEYDGYGNVLQSIAIAYGRKDIGPTASAEATIQAQTQLIYSERGYTNHIDTRAARVNPEVSKTNDYQLTGVQPAGERGIFTFTQFADDGFRLLKSVAQEIPYEEAPTPSLAQKRLIASSEAYYLKDNLTGLMDEGEIEGLMLPGVSYKLALTSGLVGSIYKVVSPIVDVSAVLTGEGGYVYRKGGWWIPSVRQDFGRLTDLVTAQGQFFIPKLFTDQFQNTTILEYDNHNLLPVKVTDPLGNILSVVNSYVHLQPSCITDFNGNKIGVVQDPLGEVVGTAISGRVIGDSLDDFAPTELDQEKEFLQNPKGDVAAQLLGNASTRTIIVYNCGPRTTEPSFRATITRETHISGDTGPQSKLLVSFTYYDGLGREIQVKKQADSVAQTDRWLGSGWTVWNNKGLAVTQYEPFFDTSHKFVNEPKHGTSAVTSFYDHRGRVVCSFAPDGTWTKEIYDSWQTTTYDASDVLKFDPSSDPDIGQFYRGWKGEEAVLDTWYSVRTNVGSTAVPLEWAAAVQSEAHHNTPTVTHLDIGGRKFVEVLDNGAGVFFATRQDFDISGNLCGVIDAQGRQVEKVSFDMCGQVLQRSTMDFGQEWLVNDVHGDTLRRWQDHDIQIRTEYDALRRPLTRRYISGGQEIMFERLVYGEPGPEVTEEDSMAHNARGKLYRHYDQSGVVTTEYDFKGNVVGTERQLALDFKSDIDWGRHPAMLQNEKFTNRTSFDALDRITEVRTDSNITRNTYTPLSLLFSVETSSPPRSVDGIAPALTPSWVPMIISAEYDAIGRQTSISYGNNTRKEYTYNPLNRRAMYVRNTTTSKKAILQDIQYTYDLRGSITHVKNGVQHGTSVCADKKYTYDAVNRLIESSGRKILGRTEGRGVKANEVGRYTEKYSYDCTGNMLSNQCSTDSDLYPGKTKRYIYDDVSALEGVRYTNRLGSTTVGRTTESFRYDVHGNVVSMPGFSVMQSNFQNQLRKTSRQVNKDPDNHLPEATYYVYGADGNRIRKVTERQSPSGATPARLYETLYLQGVEIFRKYLGDGATLSLQRKTTKVGNDASIHLIESERWGAAGNVLETPLFKYQNPDHLGSATLELDNAGNIVSYEEYSAFGELTYEAPINSLSAPRSYRFSGKEHDPETGLYYFGARYYASSLGRWISPDPSGVDDGPNVYCYVYCNPVSFVDPNGKVGEAWDTPGSEDHEAWLANTVPEMMRPLDPNANGYWDNVHDRYKLHEGFLKFTEFPARWEEPGAHVPPLKTGPEDNRWTDEPQLQRHVIRGISLISASTLVEKMRHVYEVVSGRLDFDGRPNATPNLGHREQRWQWYRLLDSLFDQFITHPGVTAWQPKWTEAINALHTRVDTMEEMDHYNNPRVQYQ